MLGAPHPPTHPASRPRDVPRGKHDLYWGRCVCAGLITKRYDRMGQKANTGISPHHPYIRPDMCNGMRGPPTHTHPPRPISK